MANSDNFFIYGRKPVEEILKTNPDEVDKVYIRNSMTSKSFQEINVLAVNNGIPVSKVPGQKIYNLVGRVNDQGIVAQKSQIRYTNFYEWAQNLYLSENPAVLFLHGIEDPHNFGAILRSAAASGFSAVMVPSQNQAPVNAVVVKTSAGTAGRIPIIRIQDVNQGLKDLKVAGFTTVALDGTANKTIWEVEMDKPMAFLIGSEGEGISSASLKKCDDIAALPLENNVESLNASVTAGLVCYEWKRRKG